MPVISMAEDPAVYKVEVKGRGVIALDVLELQGVLIEKDANLEDIGAEDVTKITDAVRAVAFPPNGGGDIQLSNTEAFAFGLKCLKHFHEAGNAPGGQPTSSPPTASSSARPA